MSSGLFRLAMPAILTAGVIVFASHGALADSELSGCEYVPRATSENAPPALAYVVKAKGCVTQCEGRVFCVSEAHQEPGFQFSPLDKEMYAKSVVCDANPDGSCPPPEDCLTAAKRQGSRFATDATVAQGAAAGADGNNYQYGFTFGYPASTVEQFSFPNAPGNSVQGSCRICVNRVVNQKGEKGATACPIRSPGACMSANDCTAAEPSVHSVGADKIQRFAPQGSGANRGSSSTPGAGAAQ